MLERYEILGCEPLHDVKHHIENMHVELPHLNKTEEKLMEETVQLSLERKEIKRGIDYRKSLITLMPTYLKCCLHYARFKIYCTLVKWKEQLKTF